MFPKRYLVNRVGTARQTGPAAVTGGEERLRNKQKCYATPDYAGASSLISAKEKHDCQEPPFRQEFLVTIPPK
jgi:hypothetical protein